MVKSLRPSIEIMPCTILILDEEVPIDKRLKYDELLEFLRCTLAVEMHNFYRPNKSVMIKSVSNLNFLETNDL